jgi:hypothetical protein
MAVIEGNMTMIDSKEAAAALSDIKEMVQRVRQSRIYDLASQFMVVAGVFVFAGNILTYFVPRYALYIWPTVNLLTVVVSAVVSTFDFKRTGVRTFDGRMLVMFILFYSFGLLCSTVLGHYGPREMGTFWPIYFMLFYCIAGLWFGHGFIAVGVTIIVLTLIGYFFITTDLFLIWMAMVNGAGLIVSGLWMRWGE